MMRVSDFPLLVGVLAFLLFSAMARAGLALRSSRVPNEASDKDLDLIVAASLTLLGLLIGFSFSMAVTRYDQRKNYEAEEANAIDTEYLRADLLPANDAAVLKPLLRQYLAERIAFYQARTSDNISRINAETGRTSSALWSTAAQAAVKQPSAPTALVAAGMNDVLNSMAYTQAAWWNRIPATAWYLMLVIAACANFLTGYSIRWRDDAIYVKFALPVLFALSFFLIADIDSTVRGLTRVAPINLRATQSSLPPS